jgi:hypothetical protein
MGTLALVVAAVALGVYADVGQRASGVLELLPQLGTPWLLVGFAGGLIWSRRPGVGVLLGPVLIATGLVSYFVFMHLAHGVNYYNLLNDGRGVYWFGLAAGLGLVAAAAGATAGGRHRTARLAAWAFPPAVALSEARWVLDWEAGAAGWQVAFGLTAVAALLLVVAVRRTGALPLLLLATATWTGLGLVAVQLVTRLR